MPLTIRSKRSALYLAAAATAIALAAGSPANASENNDQHITQDPSPEGITFSVLGDVGGDVGSTVSEQDLADLGIEVVASEAATQPSVSYVAADSEVAAALASNNVLFRWNDFKGRQVVLRSLPYDKILTKHNLTYRTPRVVTQHASTRTPDGGTSWRYRLAAKEVKCDFWGSNCKIVRTVTVRTIVDFRAYDNAGTYGVVTAYCEGISGKCPDFVKNALNQ